MITQIIPVFVELIPDEIESGKLYISEKYGCSTHSCFCGCGEKVVLDLSRWSHYIDFLEKKVTVRPSVGNFNSPCKSHYYISDNRVEHL